MPQDPEAVLAARIYRLVPARVRHVVNRAVSLERRARLKQAAAESALQQRAARVEGAARRLAIRRLLAAPGTVVVTTGGTSRVARVHDSLLTPLEARRANLRDVATALKQAGIPCFAVRGRDDRKSVLGVDSQLTELTQEVLQELCRTTGGYYALLVRDSRRGGGLRPGTRPIRRSERSAGALRVVWFRTDPAGLVTFGEQYACEIEFWERDGLGALVAPRRNRVTTELAVDEPDIEVSDSVFTRLASAAAEPLPPVVTRPSFSHPLPEDVGFPVDVVFTWVDGADPDWQRRRAQAGHVAYHEESDNDSRYLSRDELKYALRSVNLYAPWVRTIYLVTDQQVPAWLDTGCADIVVVDHRDIFSDPSVLPTFNSHAIESQLHHIDGLSEHFLYFNDDMMLAGDVTPQVFFHANGMSKFFPSHATVPQGPPQDSDTPVTIAAKNNRAVLQPLFGSAPAHKMKHAPYALRRSVLSEMEERFPEEHRRTMASRVRSPGDLSLVSNFYQYYAFHTGRAVPGQIRYRYIDVAQPDARHILAGIATSRSQHAMCLNTTSTESDTAVELTLQALESCFPLPSRFEK